MLEVKNISTGYDKKQVLFDVSFKVSDNEVVLLTGGNGSGKSTVLKCIYGLLPIWDVEGKIIFDGKDISKLATSEMVREGIVYIPQKNNYFESLTVTENLSVSGSAYSNKVIKLRKQEVFKLPNLYNNKNRTPFNLSGGERQFLALGNALMHNPRLILFDEPFAGLDDSNTKIMFNELLKLKNQKISMLIIEHKKKINSYSDKELKIYFGKLI
jgi:branched-chain amino acid transport system ATP-binding protein